MQIINTASRSGMVEGNVPGRSVNASRLERWMGRDELERVSDAMRDWYGPPIALHGVPGKVYAHRGGDFRGELRAGFEATKLDYARDFLRRMERGMRVASSRNRSQLNAGFTSLSDLIAEATGGKRRDFQYNKTGVTRVANGCYTLWNSGGTPAAGSAGGAAPGGTAHTDADTGAFPFANPASGDTQHIVSAAPLMTTTGTLLLYDRITSVGPSIAVTTAQSVTTTPTRYQNQTGGTADYVGGNFAFMEIQTVLPATAHNWDGQYTDQDGNTAQTFLQVTGIASGAAGRLDMNTTTPNRVPQWFFPLATGDVGVKQITQVQLSATLASGSLSFVLGHPIAWMPCLVAGIVCQQDYINTAFNLSRIFDDACLSFLDVAAVNTTAPVYTGMFTTVAG